MHQAIKSDLNLGQVGNSNNSLNVLLIDDSPVDRLLLEGAISSMGHKVTLASDANKAIQILRTQHFPFVVTDWRMPGMSGVELCKQIRDNQELKGTYVLLATGKNRHEDLIAGLEAGADDFITKPIQPDELRVRMKSGARIVSLQEETRRKNLELADSLQREEETNAAIREGLDTAAVMQEKLLPDHRSLFSSINTASIFQPAVGIAGDSLNVFRIDENTLGFYSIDVSGHGLASAMLSFTVTQILSYESLQNAELGVNNSAMFDPAAVVRNLNEKFNQLETIHHYFTMIYGTLNIKTGEGSFCQAGHPFPIVSKPNGRLDSIGSAGFPVGLLEDVDFVTTKFTLRAGERLYIFSDGVPDSPNRVGHLFGMQQFKKSISDNSSVALPVALNRIAGQLIEWREGRPPEDDISVLGIEYAPYQTQK